MKDSFVRARVKQSTKHEAESILQQLGISMADAINIYLAQIILHHGLPFDVKVPNKLTKDTLAKSAQGIGIAKFNSVDDLFEDLES